MTIIGYKIIDLQTGFQVGLGKTRKSANRSADRRNQEYGAHRFSVQPVYAEQA